MPGGSGGSDLYMVAINSDGSLGTPERLGDNINTEGKELFPYVDSDGTLYFSSNGHLGIGGLDVFYAEAEQDGFGVVSNMGNGVNSPADDFAYKYDPTSQSGYVSSNREGGQGSDDIYMVAAVEIPCEVTIEVLVINENTDAAVAGARVDLYDTMGNRLSSKTSNVDGMVSFKAACDQAHEVQGVLADYESNTAKVEPANDQKVSASIALKPIEQIIVEDQIVLNPILFDLDKSNIKPQAAFELDKVVAVMKKYPEMVIAVGSHTDNRATEAYNLTLSEARAQSTVQYIISKGISGKRISGKGYGESQLKVSCGAKCSEAEHQLNRRSEFTIVKK